jgi:two-component system response regulator AtoC
LLESELFGHVKGAFTDASHTKRGLFEEASSGTIFLDEIGELPLTLQVKLLRVLEEESIRRVGDTHQIKVDVRVIASTLRVLTDDVKDKRFRSDLFYRLNVLNIHLPPLRDRKEDIPLLVENFIQRFNERLGHKVRGVEPEVMDLLMSARWEGNIRELENSIERSIALSEGELITVNNLPPYLRQSTEEGVVCIPDHEMSIKKVTRNIEETLIRRALSMTAGNRTKAAKLLQISHRALLYKIRDFDIEI